MCYKCMTCTERMAAELLREEEAAREKKAKAAKERDKKARKKAKKQRQKERKVFCPKEIIQGALVSNSAFYLGPIVPHEISGTVLVVGRCFQVPVKCIWSAEFTGFDLV